ncbi:MAG: radical SAM protein [Planctomycetota bacterium]|nr:radical SAM protein [Planctomycetota bacterium]MDA1177569.1 radical SAM protein [Planctomycetota bacterium]
MATDDSIYTQHSRYHAENRFIYPVISRRSEGLSIGVNLNPDKVCNFDCIYCQVDRRRESEVRFVELPRLRAELNHMLEVAVSGELFLDGPLLRTPKSLQVLRDIAFSGDGEPTTFRNLDEIFEQCVAVKNEHNLSELKMVLITNASMFHRSRVQRALDIFDSNRGEIWAKLDAGTEDYYKLVERTTIPFRRILDNLMHAALRRPIVIQSLFMRIDGEPPTLDERLAFCRRLAEIRQAGGQLKAVQLYTVARPPAVSSVTALSNAELDDLAALVTEKTQLPVNVYYGASWQEGN